MAAWGCCGGRRAEGGPLESNEILTNLPKRDELLFRPVLALPNASRIGLDERIA